MNVLIVQNSRSALFPTKNIIDLEAWTPETKKARAVYDDLIEAVRGEDNQYIESGYRTHSVVVEEDLNINPPCEIHEVVYVACT